MGTNITLTSEDGFELSAYRAEPEGKARGGVVVIQEIFGVNSHIREVVDRYAAAGYLAVAPAIFDRVERGVNLGYTPEDMQAGIAIVSGGQLDFTKVLADARAAGRSVASAGKVGITGYCFGGLVTAASSIHSAEVFSAGSSYYGGNTITLIGQKPAIPLQAHYGEQDHYIPMTDVQKIKDAWSNAEVYAYDADHGFNCDQRATFHAQSAAVAQARTFRFFDQHIG
jgi:carboxymethylenebutenolidase